jgi:hypothetical protein
MKVPMILLNASEYANISPHCRACGANLTDFLAYEQYHEILYCLGCHEEVPIEDVSFDAYYYHPSHSRHIEFNYYENERKEWRKSRRRHPK